MINTIRTRVDKTKEFVKKHQTTTACAATALVTYGITRKTTLRGAITGCTDAAYAWGARAGIMEMHIDALHAFVESKDLKDEFIAFATPGN